MKRSFISVICDGLLGDFGNDTGTDGAAAFADSEAKALLHGYRCQEFDLECDGITRHDHFFVSW